MAAETLHTSRRVAAAGLAIKLHTKRPRASATARGTTLSGAMSEVPAAAKTKAAVAWTLRFETVQAAEIVHRYRTARAKVAGSAEAKAAAAGRAGRRHPSSRAADDEALGTHEFLYGLHEQRVEAKQQRQRKAHAAERQAVDGHRFSPSPASKQHLRRAKAAELEQEEPAVLLGPLPDRMAAWLERKEQLRQQMAEHQAMEREVVASSFRALPKSHELLSQSPVQRGSIATREIDNVRRANAAAAESYRDDDDATEDSEAWGADGGMDEEEGGPAAPLGSHECLSEPEEELSKELARPSADPAAPAVVAGPAASPVDTAREHRRKSKSVFGKR